MSFLSPWLKVTPEAPTIKIERMIRVELDEVKDQLIE